MSETIINKQCSSCKKSKVLTNFPRNRNSEDGRHNQCKKCHNEANNRYMQTDKGKASYLRKLNNPQRKIGVRRYLDSPQGKLVKAECFRRYMSSEKGKKYRKTSDKRRRCKCPMKFEARLAVSHAIERGDMMSASLYKCTNCGQQAKFWHHHKGYMPPHWLDVIALCPNCDRLAHKSA